MIHSKTIIHNWFTYIMFTNLRKTHPERILRIMMKWIIKCANIWRWIHWLSLSYDISCCVFLLKYTSNYVVVTKTKIVSDTLGNVQTKGSNTISPNCFGMCCIIRIIIKATHLCNCIVHQHNLKCIWVEIHNNWYHMTLKTHLE